ncbi:MAG: 4Fe-4S dicluster domain-containing protein [Nitrososphaerales archaeon]|jgi:anaerobic dimethyl sulfoxide reductase subunit B
MSSTTTSTTATYSASGSTVTQYGFFFDQSRCVHCSTCAVACKEWNLLSPGPAKWLRVFEWDSGTFPNIRVNTLFAPCYHCANPVCVTAANGAMFKEPTYGAVLIDPSYANSSNLRAAAAACPYGAIVFDSDSPTANASKCTMCVDRLVQGLKPVCVMSCAMRALDFGPVTQLAKTYPDATSDLTGVPSSKTTSPAVLFRPSVARKTLVPYDPTAAAPLLANRGSTLPAAFDTLANVTSDPNGIAGKQTLNIKPTNSTALMLATQDEYS